MKKALLTSVIFLSACATMKGKSISEPQIFKIEWASFEMQNRKFERAGILFQMPVLNDKIKTVTAQFDSGAYKSFARVPESFTGNEIELLILGERRKIGVVKNVKEGQPSSLLLSVDVLQDVQIRIDFEKNLLELARNFNEDGFLFEKIKKDMHGRMNFFLKVSERPPVEVMLDTGAAIFDVSSTAALARDLIPAKSKPVFVLVLPPYTHPDDDKELKMKTYNIQEPIRFGPITREDFEISVHESKNPSLDFSQYQPPIFGIVGLGFFKSAKALILDLRNERIGVKQ